MASIVRQANGRRLIQFIDPHGERRTIRLGKTSQRVAESVKHRVECLVSAKIAGHAPDDETARWLANLDYTMAKKLAAVDLAVPRESTMLEGFIDAYIATRCDTKPNTQNVYGHTRRNLIEYFGAKKPLRDITPGDADQWRLSLLGQGLSEKTVRRRTGIAKQFFTAAMRKDLISTNPFAGLKVAVQANPKLMYFVSRKEAEKVLNACPDAQWRLLFALSRFGGLRCPSEHLALRWSHVNWEHNRLHVPSPKTEHHPGGEVRVIPLFPELMPHLQEVFDEAEEGTEFVITRYRDRNSNLRTQLQRIIERAGLKPWPKLFQNLRSTRETELAEDYPLHVVCAWIGNSQLVAAKHYLQITDEHFDRAAGKPVNAAATQSEGHQSAAKCAAAGARTALHGNVSTSTHRR